MYKLCRFKADFKYLTVNINRCIETMSNMIHDTLPQLYTWVLITWNIYNPEAVASFHDTKTIYCAVMLLVYNRWKAREWNGQTC